MAHAILFIREGSSSSLQSSNGLINNLEIEL
jgi:hypothetical protein